MLKRTEGIVLRNRPHGDADLIVTYLTSDSGIRSLYARSPRKVGSRFGGSLEPLTYARISFVGKEQARLPRLIQSDIIRPFNTLREDMDSFVRVSEALELTVRLIPEGEPSGRAFRLLLEVLSSLEHTPRNTLLLSFYKVRLLDLTGFAPRVGGCARCGAETERFYPGEGATLCRGCGEGAGGFIELHPSVKRLYGYLLRTGPSTINRLRLTDAVYTGLEGLISSHIGHTVVERLNTREFAEVLRTC